MTRDPPRPMSTKRQEHTRAAGSLVALSLEAVIIAVTDVAPRLLVSMGRAPGPMIPSGPFDADRDQTLERSLRRWVRDRTGLALGYVEQLYSFGDRGRRPDVTGPLPLSVAYLALAREEQPSSQAAWIDSYDLFPWEDHRGGPPPISKTFVRRRLSHWAGDNKNRRARMRETFGVPPMRWDPVRVLERYELLYEAKLVAEYFVDHGRAIPRDLPTGAPLAYDHRRITASALGRLRGKLTYRPVVFELLPDAFTLAKLQQTVEALIGLRVHKQNFRRLVEQGHLVEGTGRRSTTTGGRPAELFRFREEVRREKPRPGVRWPGR